MSEQVLLSVVNKIRAVMAKPAIPVGRIVIDHELNKKRDPVVADQISSAIRWLTQANELARQVVSTPDSDSPTPRFWLLSRDIPTDQGGYPIELTYGLRHPVEFDFIDDVSPPPKSTPVVVEPKPQAEAKPQEAVKGPPSGSIDARILAEVTRLCGKDNRPVRESTLMVAIEGFGEYRVVRMRLSYVCKVSCIVKRWEDTACGEPCFWPASQPLSEDLIEDFGQPDTPPAKVKRAPWPRNLRQMSRPRKLSLRKSSIKAQQHLTSLLPSQTLRLMPSQSGQWTTRWTSA